MSKPNFRWFVSGDYAVAFNVDDVSCISIAPMHIPYTPLSGINTPIKIITIEFYHRDVIKVSDHAMDNNPLVYQQVYNWVKNELVSNPAIEVKEER